MTGSYHNRRVGSKLFGASPRHWQPTDNRNAWIRYQETHPSVEDIPFY